MTSQEVILPFNNVDQTGEVLQILEEENEALLGKVYKLTPQKSNRVDKCFDILSGDRLARNNPKKHAHRFLHAALRHSKEFFLLCALAGGKAPTSTFLKIKTDLQIQRVLKWWNTAYYPLRLGTYRDKFSFKFSDQPNTSEKSFTVTTTSG